MIDKARSVYGRPMHVTSGYRTRAHNHKVGGAINSAHMEGLAADIRCKSNIDRIEMILAFIEAGFRRIGVARTFIHVDCDPSKRDAMWTY